MRSCVDSDGVARTGAHPFQLDLANSLHLFLEGPCFKWEEPIHAPERFPGARALWGCPTSC